MLQAWRDAHKAHAKRLADEGEELAKKWTMDESEKEMQREIEKQKEKEVEKLEKGRLTLSDREKELMKAEKQKNSGLQIAKTLYEEANERLTQAINERATSMPSKSWNMQWSKTRVFKQESRA